jgi:uncharacterized protein with NAD-binding domain and iron-sulfur cluster
MAKVIVIGGGVAGMSAAHELAERGFEVEVYEHKKKYCGGKARSVDVPGSVPGKKPLPGEHGFRFFPGFYKHITDTMKRIPAEGGKSVFDNLVPTEHIMLARNGKPPIEVLAHFPRSLSDLEFMFKNMHPNTGLTPEEIKFFAERVWQLMTSCFERRTNEYERIGWWEYLQADRFSVTYQTLLAAGLTRTLVAAQAKKASTKTGGDIFLQLIFNMVDPFVNTDRVLNGPTNDAWLNHWKKYLINKLGVKYNFGYTAKEIFIKDGKISGVQVINNNVGTTVTGDYYLFAVPVEQLSVLVNDDMVKVDMTLASIKPLSTSVNWMNGIQFYLNQNVEINKGHVILSDSQWAITCISQTQFWQGIDISQYGDGKVKSVLSVDISDWFDKGTNGKVASDCTRDEVKDEVWTQLKAGLNVGGNTMISDNMIEAWYLDRDIKPIHDKVAAAKLIGGNATMEELFDKEPLLVNSVNTWMLRPDSYTAIPNMFIAGDFVRTHTDLATMEGANEAARRAVNDIIKASGSGNKQCKIWNLHEPLILAPFRWADKKRYSKGLPWETHIAWLAKIVIFFVKIIIKIFKTKP